jgi:hypothetical protein
MTEDDNIDGTERAERIAATPKRTRNKLCKAELWLSVAASHAVNDLGTLAANGEIPEFEQGLIDRYGVTPADIQRFGREISDELERRALRAGYEDALIGGWDE